MDRMTSKHRFLTLALGSAVIAATLGVPTADAAGRRDIRAERRADADDDRRDRGAKPSRWIEDRRGHRKAAPSRRPERPAMVRRPIAKPVIVSRPAHRPVIVQRPMPRPVAAHWWRPSHRPVIVNHPVRRPVVVKRPASWYGWRHRDHRRRHFVYRDRHGNEVAAAIIGFGLGFVAKAILDDHHHAVPEKVVYVPLADGADVSGEPVRCLQTREYQTTIDIDGIAREAYGTACLQPDGAWLMGAPEPVDEVEDYNG